MTNKERVLVLSIFISVFGFSLFNVVNPLEQHIGKPSMVVASEYISKIPISEESTPVDYNFEIARQYSRFDGNSSKMVNMLSITLGIPTEDIKDALDGGTKPSEMLASEGILLSDLAEDFNFDIVGERGLVRFRG
jgi:hypothetical protein